MTTATATTIIASDASASIINGGSSKVMTVENIADVFVSTHLSSSLTSGGGASAEDVFGASSPLPPTPNPPQINTSSSDPFAIPAPTDTLTTTPPTTATAVSTNIASFRPPPPLMPSTSILHRALPQASKPDDVEVETLIREAIIVGMYYIYCMVLCVFYISWHI